MNYDELNKIYNYWRKKIVPYLDHKLTVSSFDAYLKKFSFLPSGKWLKDFDSVKLNRNLFAVDPEKLVKKYKDSCVAYNAPSKPEDGVQRVIYQISPTLHMEAAFWIWVEQEELNSYAGVFICYHDDDEYLSVLDDLYKMRKEGKTDERKKKAGFANFLERQESHA
jgi:hypothetical protein